MNFPNNSTYIDFTLPVAFTLGAFAVAASDVLVDADTNIYDTSSPVWNVGATTKNKIRFITTFKDMGVFDAVIIGK